MLKRIQRVLEIEEPLVHQKPPKEPTDRQRCYMCLQKISGTPNYKEKKDKLGKPKWVCKECKRVICIPSSSACVVRRNKHQAMTNNFDILDKLLISFGITNSRLEKVNFICILPTFYKDVCYLFTIETFQVF